MGIGSGISFSVQGVQQALGNLQVTVVGTPDNPGSVANTLASLVGPWRPPQWSSGAQNSITVLGSPFRQQVSGGPAASGQTGQGVPGGAFKFSVTENVAQSGSPTVVYVFDAVLQLDHAQEMQLTAHPVQSGANIADHAFQKPARLSMDIGMSDAMDSFVAGQWSGAQSKSVNCYQTMLALEQARSLVIVNTRLNTYRNMVITAFHTRDDNKTKHGLRATITFEEVFMAQVTTSNSNWSARPQRH